MQTRMAFSDELAVGLENIDAQFIAAGNRALREFLGIKIHAHGVGVEAAGIGILPAAR